MAKWGLFTIFITLVAGRIRWIISVYNQFKNKSMENIFDLTELIDATATETGIPKASVHVSLKTAFDILSAKIAAESKAEIHGFGSFHLVQIAGEKGTDPHGNHYEVGPRFKVEFNAFKPLRDAIETKTGTPAIL